MSGANKQSKARKGAKHISKNSGEDAARSTTTSGVELPTCFQPACIRLMTQENQDKILKVLRDTNMTLIDDILKQIKKYLDEIPKSKLALMKKIEYFGAKITEVTNAVQAIVVEMATKNPYFNTTKVAFHLLQFFCDPHKDYNEYAITYFQMLQLLVLEIRMMPVNILKERNVVIYQEKEAAPKKCVKVCDMSVQTEVEQDNMSTQTESITAEFSCQTEELKCDVAIQCEPEVHNAVIVHPDEVEFAREFSNFFVQHASEDAAQYRVDRIPYFISCTVEQEEVAEDNEAEEFAERIAREQEEEQEQAIAVNQQPHWINANANAEVEDERNNLIGLRWREDLISDTHSSADSDDFYGREDPDHPLLNRARDNTQAQPSAEAQEQALRMQLGDALVHMPEALFAAANQPNFDVNYLHHIVDVDDLNHDELLTQRDEVYDAIEADTVVDCELYQIMLPTAHGRVISSIGEGFPEIRAIVYCPIDHAANVYDPSYMTTSLSDPDQDTLLTSNEDFFMASNFKNRLYLNFGARLPMDKSIHQICLPDNAEAASVAANYIATLVDVHIPARFAYDIVRAPVTNCKAEETAEIATQTEQLCSHKCQLIMSMLALNIAECVDEEEDRGSTIRFPDVSLQTDCILCKMRPAFSPQ